MIVASSGQIAPVSGHDHEVTRAAGRILERLMSLRSRHTLVTDGTRGRAALKAWMPHSYCVSDMAGHLPALSVRSGTYHEQRQLSKSAAAPGATCRSLRKNPGAIPVHDRKC